MKNPVSKVVASLFLFCSSVGISILVMMYGWGLQPVSWWWIIGGGVGIKVLVDVMLSIQKEE